MAVILAVDDNDDMLDIYRHILSPMGFDVWVGKTRTEMFEMISTRLPDLIILDVMLGAENGVGICRELKSSNDYAHIPIMLITASHFKDGQFDDASPDAIIEKPFDITEFLNRLEALLVTKKS